MQSGYEVIFISPQNRRHGGSRVSEWIIARARDLGIQKVTRRLDTEGTGSGGRLHSWHFFEQADQPEEIMFVLDEATADQLIEAVTQAGVHVFCLRRPVAFGELNPGRTP